jgi:hypothetical protein
VSAVEVQKEQVVIGAAEKLMEETMARYDPSHDVYHASGGPEFVIFISTVH